MAGHHKGVIYNEEDPLHQGSQGTVMISDESREPGRVPSQGEGDPCPLPQHLIWVVALGTLHSNTKPQPIRALPASASRERPLRTPRVLLAGSGDIFLLGLVWSSQNMDGVYLQQQLVGLQGRPDAESFN